MTGLLRRPLGPARVIAVSLGMAALLVLVCFASMLFGTAEISLEQVRALLFSSGDTGVGHARLILLDIRLPRIILAALVGFALALGWQVFSLSIGAVVLLMYLINNGEAGRVSSMFYLVPPLVVIEAHFLFNETLGLLSIAGMLISIVGVIIVNRPARPG